MLKRKSVESLSSEYTPESTRSQNSFLFHDLRPRAVNHFLFVRTIKQLVSICVLLHSTDLCCESRDDSCRHFQYTINFVQLSLTEYMFRRVVYYHLKQNHFHLLMFSGVQLAHQKNFHLKLRHLLAAVLRVSCYLNPRNNCRCVAGI